MPDVPAVLTGLGATVVAAPAALVLFLGAAAAGTRPAERAAGRAVAAAVVVGLAAALAVLVGMLATGTRHVVVDCGDWVDIGLPPAGGHAEPGGAAEAHYQFAVKFVFDRLSVPFVALTFVLCGTVGAFSTRYLHREPGYNRFFVLFALFLLGMVVAALADTIETLFFGWELVGLSSALLVGFFQERAGPARNALRVWVVYRVADAALLLAAVALHHTAGEGDFDKILGADPWPGGAAAVTATQALVVGGLLLIAAAGKSALVPFSGWLPRAMEGPTPSSAVFYGALSVHLGAYLLLRVGPILDAAPALSAVVCVLGLVTAGYAALVGRVQTDIKSALSFASLAQVGLIVAEIGAGWRYVPLVHLLGHACLRTLQFLRAPSALQEHRMHEDATGGRLTPRARPAGRAGGWVYRFALERGYLDALLAVLIVDPFTRLFRGLDALERRATAALAGAPAPPPAAGPTPAAADAVPVEQLV